MGKFAIFDRNHCLSRKLAHGYYRSLIGSHRLPMTLIDLESRDTSGKIFLADHRNYSCIV